MPEYLVTTQEGKVIASVPELPLQPEQLAELNRLGGLHGNYQWPYLYDLNMGFFDCQVIDMNGELDIAVHRLLQVV